MSNIRSDQLDTHTAHCGTIISLDVTRDTAATLSTNYITNTELGWKQAHEKWKKSLKSGGNLDHVTLGLRLQLEGHSTWLRSICPIITILQHPWPCWRYASYWLLSDILVMSEIYSNTLEWLRARHLTHFVHVTNTNGCDSRYSFTYNSQESYVNHFKRHWILQLY